MDKVYVSEKVSLNKPFPGEYEFLGKVESTELDIAAKILIPRRTIEPWQVHYDPFREKIIVEKGLLSVQKPRKYADGYPLRQYLEGDSVKIPSCIPHRLMNTRDEDLIIVVETSPGPEHRLDLEPEFSSLTECIDDLYKHLSATVNIIKFPLIR